MSAQEKPDEPRQKVARLLDVLQHERERTREILETLETAPPVEQCGECERLLAVFVFSMVRTTSVLQEKGRAAQAGLIDDLNFLASDDALEEALQERQRARETYFRHRGECH